MPNAILRLALPSPLRRLFDYRAPAGVPRAQLQPGMRLRVPFGRREMIGILVEVTDHSEVPADKLKPALALLDATPPLPASLFKLCLWTAQYYQHSLGDTLSWALPTLLRQGEPAEMRQERFWHVTPGARLEDPRIARAPRQRDALKTLAQHPHGVAHSLLGKLNLNKDSLDLLLAKDLVQVEVRRHLPSARHEHWLAQPELPLNDEQREAFDSVREGFGGFAAFLLAGVTGSGKTEVYLQLIRETLEAGKQALVLIPEINLGPQTLARFEQRFNARIALLHSAVSDRERLDAWLAARDGEADIIIGTRSALFTPMKNPGLIIIDEEHDGSYKQQEGLRYHARDLALVRAHQENIPILLGSATPSLESLHNAHTGRYGLLQRAADAAVQRQAFHIQAQHARWAGSASALVHAQQAIATGERVVQGFQRRGGGTKQDRDVFLVSAHQRQVAGVVAQAFLLLIRTVVFFVDDDQARVLHRGEQRRTCTDDDVGFAVAGGQPGIKALTVVHGRVQQGDAGVEALLETRQGLRAEVDLGDQHQRLLTGFQGFADQLQVHLGLAAAGDAGQQEGAEAVKALAHGVEGIALFFIEGQFRLRQPVFMAKRRQVAAYFQLYQLLGQQQVEAVLVQVELAQQAVRNAMRVLGQGLEGIALARGAGDAGVLQACAGGRVPEALLAHFGRFTLAQQGG